MIEHKNSYPRPVILLKTVPHSHKWMLVSLKGIWDEEEQGWVCVAHDMEQHAMMIFQATTNLPNEARWSSIPDKNTFQLSKKIQRLYQEHGSYTKPPQADQKGG